MKYQKGFAMMIELMCVVAISGILASLAVPTMMAANEHAQIKRAINDLTFIRSDLSTYLLACDQSPATLTLATLPHYTVSNTCVPGGLPYVQGAANGSYVSSLTLNGMTLNATLSRDVMPLIQGKVITMQAIVVNGALSWTCYVPVAGMINCGVVL